MQENHGNNNINHQLAASSMLSSFNVNVKPSS